MKLYKISFLMLGAAMLTVSCNDIDKQYPEGGSLTAEQVKETNTAIPARVDATFSGMFSMMAEPGLAFPTRSSVRPDDWGFGMINFSLDLEGADVFMENSGYNWFSVCGAYTSRDADYANPYTRYVIPYREIGVCNEVIAAFPEDTQSETAINEIAQARAMRAYSYMQLAPYFQFNYQNHKDEPCIPILSAGVDYANNPRATVGEVWKYIMDDLNYAVEHLTLDRTSKDRINVNVAYGLRARANLYMGNWAEAAADAVKAMEGYSPASMAEISVPAFCNLNEHNWIWGVNITTELQAKEPAATIASWMSAFTANGYGPACQIVPRINSLLYNKIPTTDLRRNWWLDENLHTPNWANLTWVDSKSGASATGDEIAELEIEDVKMKMLPLTNVKFGMKSGVGSVINDCDIPLMRVEEMILIQAEGLARNGQESQARQILESFVKTYRDPSYSSNGRGLDLTDEIWFQRRVELWGEGFFMFDAKRLGKPVVRTHGADTTNVPDAFAFNIAADDGWLNMRFPQDEMDNNIGIIDNKGGSVPIPGQNSNLRDGVTD